MGCCLFVFCFCHIPLVPSLTLIHLSLLSGGLKTLPSLCSPGVFIFLASGLTPQVKQRPPPQLKPLGAFLWEPEVSEPQAQNPRSVLPTPVHPKG